MNLKRSGKAVVESEDEELKSKEKPNASQPKSIHYVASVDNLEDAGKGMRLFSDTKFVNPKSELVSLKHTVTIEKYHEEGAGIVVKDINIFLSISKFFVARYRVESIVDFCDKFKGAYSMVFVDKLVALSDPYRFRLLVMERKSTEFEELTTMVASLEPSI